MTTYNPNDFYPRSGAEIDSSGNVKNDADGLNVDGSKNVKIIGRNYVVQQIIGTSDATVSVAALATQYSSYIDVSLYKAVAVYVVSDQIYDITRYFSFNGVMGDQGSTIGSSQGATGTGSRYSTIISNNDAVPFLRIGVKNDSTTTAANIKVYIVGVTN